MDAVLYVDRTTIPWRHLPRDFAPCETVYGYFAARRRDTVFDHLNGLLRRLVREAKGRNAEPSACVLDVQSSANVPAIGQGIGAGKTSGGEFGEELRPRVRGSGELLHQAAADDRRGKDVPARQCAALLND